MISFLLVTYLFMLFRLLFIFPYVFISCFNKFLRSAIHLFCSTVYVWSSFLYWSNSLFIFVVLLFVTTLHLLLHALFDTFYSYSLRRRAIVYLYTNHRCNSAL